MDAPSCCPTLTVADATPASCGATPKVPVLIAGATTRPSQLDLRAFRTDFVRAGNTIEVAASNGQTPGRLHVELDAVDVPAPERYLHDVDSRRDRRKANRQARGSLAGSSRRTSTALSSARDAGASQHAPEIDEHLYVDVFAMRRVERLRLAAECDAEPAVALLLHGPYRFEQRADAAPFHIAARRPVEDLLDRVSVLGAEMRIHRFGSL
jgi:hypothetical protein